MKVVAIADTHGQHNALKLPKGDVIIHAGDISKRGERHEIENFLNWYKELDFKYKVFIAGNHDFFFERATQREIEELIPDSVIYLCDSGIVLDTIKIWGSPVTPWFFDWAFNRHRGEAISKHWQLIPADTDILITHGPVSGKLDKTKTGQHAGCADLLKTVQDLKPKVHLCGHIHEAQGELNEPVTKFINASVLDENYVLKNAPVVFEI